MDINGYHIDISQDPGPNGKWYWSSYPTLKKPQGPYDDYSSAESAAKSWAESMPNKLPK